jgi:hypothetical protein
MLEKLIQSVIYFQCLIKKTMRRFKIPPLSKHNRWRLLGRLRGQRRGNKNTLPDKYLTMNLKPECFQVSFFTKYLNGALILIGLIGCGQIDSQYYLSYRKDEYIISRNKHYRLFKLEEDSIRVWVLSHDYNGGYFSWKKSHTVPKRVGKFGIVQITDISDHSIKVTMTEGGTEHNLGRLYPVAEQDAFEVLNILKMLDIDYKMENYIQEEAKCAVANTIYISDRYSADENCSELNLIDFEVYYTDKMKKKALEAIREIDSIDCSKLQSTPSNP